MRARHCHWEISPVVVTTDMATGRLCVWGGDNFFSEGHIPLKWQRQNFDPSSPVSEFCALNHYAMLLFKCLVLSHRELERKKYIMPCGRAQ